jgi:hypothetical protein
MYSLTNDESKMRLRVECCSRRNADDPPVRFQLGERGYLVEEVLDRMGAARSGLLGVAALEIFDHLFDGRDFTLEPLCQFFQGFDPLFAGVETPAAPWASACEA